MERKGGCLLVPRYGGAGAGSGVGGQAPGMSWQMGRIMLKFRPIAPKPAAMAPGPSPPPVAAVAAAGRGKRKAVGGGGGGRRGRKPKKAATVAPVAAVRTVGGKECEKKEKEKEKSLSSRSSSSSAMTSVDSSPPSPPPPLPQQQPATLPLMPVSPAEEEKAEAPPAPAEVPAGAQSVGPRPTAAPVASSWVTVEDVASTWRDGEAPFAVAAASACGADGDAAPAFVSDQWGRVTWANAAFTQAVSSDDDTEGAAGVALAGALPAWGTCAGFTCRVRVVRRANLRRGGCVVAPCDVWRLDTNGCYLWRLDLQAALTLGGLP